MNVYVLESRAWIAAAATLVRATATWRHRLQCADAVLPEVLEP